MQKDNNEGFLNINRTLYRTRISSKFRNRKIYSPVNLKVVLSYIPGTILEVLVNPGSDVRKGDDLMILDAMKMKNRIKCTMDGKVKSVFVKEGSRVAKGSALLELE